MAAFGQLLESPRNWMRVLAKEQNREGGENDQAWISHGASGGDTKKINIILLCASATSRPSCARRQSSATPRPRSAGAHDCLRLAPNMARRKLLNASFELSAPTLNALDAQTRMVIRPSSRHCLRIRWEEYVDPWSRANARRHAASLGKPEYYPHALTTRSGG